MNKTIITCAVTGAGTRPDQTPYLPITPEQISQSSLEAAAAGAAVVHIHVRNPITGSPSMELELYRECVDSIKKHNNDVLINLTTGPGATYFPEPGNLAVGSKTSLMLSASKRVQHIEIIKPDLCSIDFNTMHQSNGGVRINHIKIVKEMIKLVQAAGTKPELELFDSGDFRMAKDLIDDGTIGSNPYWQFAMGIKYGWDATPEALSYARSLLPSKSTWSAFGISKNQMPYVALAHLLGGHVRVGMEDNIYLEKGVLAISNAQLVSKATDVITLLGGEVASPAEARKILCL